MTARTFGLEEMLPADRKSQLRAHLAILVANAVVDAYRSGEVGFLQALAVVDKVAAGSGRENRIAILGEMAIELLELGEPKYLGRSKPVHPEWLKKLAVSLVFSVRESAPWKFDFDSGQEIAPMPVQAARTYVTALLARVKLCPTPLSERTLHDWCLEHQRAIGKSAKAWPTADAEVISVRFLLRADNSHTHNLI